MLLNGPSVQHQESQECLTLSQLICFNVKCKVHTTGKNRHSKSRETPLPGLSIHTLTRSKKIVTILNGLGISVSYSRVREVENLLAAALCKHGVVCPAKGLHVVGASIITLPPLHPRILFMAREQFPICRNPVIDPSLDSTSYSLPEMS